jgi:hypothetical protein
MQTTALNLKSSCNQGGGYQQRATNWHCEASHPPAESAAAVTACLLPLNCPCLLPLPGSRLQTWPSRPLLSSVPLLLLPAEYARQSTPLRRQHRQQTDTCCISRRASNSSSTLQHTAFLDMAERTVCKA